MKTIKYIAFGALAVVLLLLGTATVLEKFYGTPFVAERIYGSAGFVALWGVAALFGTAWIVLSRRLLRPAALLLHASLLLILAGALVTWLSGERGTLRLRTGEPFAVSFADAGGTLCPLPFRVGLAEFRIRYYDGTRAPADYVSELLIADGADTLCAEVSMNRIFRRRHYRFYQSGFDEDGRGTVLSVSHDPWGIGLTYAGYALFALSALILPLDRRSRLRGVLRSRTLRRVACVALLLLPSLSASAEEQKPRVLPRAAADRLGRLCVCYNDRICPLSTLAAEFTVKLCGSRSYRGFTPEQVLSGWLFYYDDWKKEPMIDIRNAGARRLLGIEGKYARLSDFRGGASGYRLEGDRGRGAREADEKFGIVSQVAAGSAIRLFPYVDPDEGRVVWASLTDDLPKSLPYEQWVFIRRSMNYVNELVVARDYDKLAEVLDKIGAYQRKEGGTSLPSAGRLHAERFYNRLGGSLPVAVCLLLAGIGVFLHACRRMARGAAIASAVKLTVTVVAALCFAWLTLTISLRGYVSGRWPLANGFETMQFMAWCALLLPLFFHRRFPLMLPFGCLVAGLAAMVSVMGEANPAVTPLMPVLSSPLLCLHVVLVMIAYALLALLTFNGLAGLILRRKRPCESRRLAAVGRLILYPALFCLGAGIFVGAVWANVSWGRYWGWDPKEVWALVTMLLYALALHGGSLPAFRRPGFFHAFCVAAFLSVLITYFGVNFLLGGMHSYAG